MPEPLRFGLIGVGMHGPFYQAYVRGVGDEPGGQISALADVDKEALHRAAQELGVAQEHCYTDFQTFLFRERMDAVIVATPPRVREPAKLAVELGRPVFCENPLATTLVEAQAIADAYNSRDKTYVCTINEQWLWLPWVQKLVELFQQGRIGQLWRVIIGGKGREVRVERERIGSHLLSVAIHHFTGPVQTCTASPGEALAVYETGGDVPIILDLTLSPTGYDVGRCFLQLDGTEGRLKAIGGFLERVFFHPCPYDSVAEENHPLHEGWESISLPNVWTIRTGMEPQALADSTMNPTFWLMDQFTKAVRGEAENPYPPERFVPVAEAMELHAQSARTGRMTMVQKGRS